MAATGQDRKLDLDLGGPGISFDMGVRYNTYLEQEAAGRFPVQVNEHGCYPSALEMPGIKMVTHETYVYHDGDHIMMCGCDEATGG